MIFLRDGEIAVRTNEHGGDVTQKVEYGPYVGVLAKTRIVLLIHGYCNDLMDARESYSKFVANLQDGPGLRPDWASDVVRFYWPGDKPWSFVRFLSYPWEIKPAKESAQVLADFLRGLGHPLELYVVAHSLGNRVTLEMLEVLLKNDNPALRIKGVCMMAAAVPVSMVRWPGQFNFAATRLRTLALYSPGDLVLRFAFREGELLGGDALWPEAVGLNGEPCTQWKASQPMFYGNNKRYNHPDYWPQKETTLPIGNFFDPTSPVDLPARATPEHYLPAANELKANRIGSW